MGLLWSKSRFGKAVETGLYLLDMAIGFGLVSGAAVAIALGKFFLGGLLGAIFLGVIFRLTRRSREHRAHTRKG